MEKAGLTLVARWREYDAETDSAEEHLRYAIEYADWVERQER
jgi:hypothetical protein